MTYCLGILLPDGLVLASDSRSNAGVDQLATVRKLSVFEQPGERMIVVLSAGNLATTQAVVTTLRQNLGSGEAGRDLFAAQTMFNVTQTVGDMLREILAREATHVQPFGDPNASFIVGGQIAGGKHRIFQVYSAGNFVEASARTQFLQIGETKYGKPILDRALTNETSLQEAAKLALLSYDATIRSNLSVDAPIDMMIYRRDSLDGTTLRKFNRDDDYWHNLRDTYSKGLGQLVQSLPSPPDFTSRRS
ncbi:peptidase [Alphaproteobacteria bacterium HT1-32]|nr:peptidase [Alphaproteobacteria bacterium HT1-32]